MDFIKFGASSPKNWHVRSFWDKLWFSSEATRGTRNMDCGQVISSLSNFYRFFYFIFSRPLLLFGAKCWSYDCQEGPNSKPKYFSNTYKYLDYKGNIHSVLFSLWKLTNLSEVTSFIQPLWNWNLLLIFVKRYSWRTVFTNS